MFNRKYARQFRRAITCILLIFIALLSANQSAFSQKSGREKTSREKRSEREKKEKFHPIEIKSLNDTLIPLLTNKVSSYTFTIDRDSFLLTRNYDLTAIEENLPAIESKIKEFRMIFNRAGQHMNFQGLNTSSIILHDIENRLKSYQVVLEGYKSDLTEAHKRIQKITMDTSLSVQVADSALSSEMDDAIFESFALSRAQRLKLAEINLVNSRVSVSLFESRDIISDMLYQNIEKKENLFIPSEKPLFQSNRHQYLQSTGAIVSQGIIVSAKVILIYLAQRINILVLALLIFIAIFIWCTVNIHQIRKRKDASEIMHQVIFLKRSVLVGCLLALFTYIPLFFADPPMALQHAFELLRLAALSILIFPFLTGSFKKVWIVFIILWLFYALDDLLLRASFGERWLLFVAGTLLALVFIAGIWQSKKIFKGIERSPVTRIILIFSLILSLASVAFNLSGNLSLAKMAGITAVQCIMLGLTLKIFCTMVVEAIYLQSEAYHESRFSEFLNFEKLKLGLRRVLWVLACIVWIIALVRDLTLYSWFSVVVIHFFRVKRPIGKYHFTFASVVVFIFIIWISSLISRIVNYFFGYEKSVATGKRSSINSMALIFRLCIWAVGFLIAVAAAGIPLDKISIMLGALGVGIGFGLQTIVNNLVSGVILAFERPVQIGDQIEVGGRSGIVKEIGVRASKIRNFDGADIIIPNGDLLSQQLINWTMQNRNQRVQFTFGVPYDTNLEKVQSLILNKLKDNKDILHYPAPGMIVVKFSQFAVDLQLLFWVPDLSDSDTVRTNIMMDVKDLLSKEGIQLQARLINPYDLQDKMAK